MMHPNNYPGRNYPAAARGRGGPGPMVPPHMQPQHPGAMPPQQQMMAQRYNPEQARIIEEARRKTLDKPVDRNLPDGIEDLALGDGAQHYNSMRDIERKLDAVMMRKRLDIQDSVQRAPMHRGTMRIWISNTVENQPWQERGMDPESFDFSSNVNAVFRVKIEGRLLDNDIQSLFPSESNGDASKDSGLGISEAQTESPNGERQAKRPKLSTPPSHRRHKLSHFFQSITIDFDRSSSLQPDNYTRIQWPNDPQQTAGGGNFDPPREADFDCLEFERKGDENINVTIELVRANDKNHEPRYKLAPPLAELLDLEEANRKTVLMGIWEYAKANGLQHEGNDRVINCDDRLRAVFPGRDHIDFPDVPQLISAVMFPLPPIKLDYTIRVDKEFHMNNPQPTIYDIPIPLEDPLTTQLETLTKSSTHMAVLRECAEIDDTIALFVQRMNQAKAKHGFFTAMSKDPAGFVQRWISSQKRDLDVLAGAGAWGEEDYQNAEWRVGGLQGPWGSDQAWEGVGSYLSKQPKQSS